MKNSGQGGFLTVEQAPLPFVICVVLMGAALASCFAVASKIIVIFGMTASGGAIGYAITYIATDAISELYGKKKANQVVFAGVIAAILTMLLMVTAIRLPYADFWDNQEGFENTLGLSVRLAIATIVAYLASQFHDVWAFHMWREKTQARHLWLRNNLSTGVSQAIDTIIFITIAFWGIFPLRQLLFLVLGKYLIKLGIAILDTPVIYLVVAVVRRTYAVRAIE